MRSFLFVPADSERKLARAPQSGADALILDLEDSVVAGKPPHGAHSGAAISRLKRLGRFSALGAHQPARNKRRRAR